MRIGVQLNGPFDKKVSIMLDRDVVLSLVHGDTLSAGVHDFCLNKKRLRCDVNGELVSANFYGEFTYPVSE